MTANDEHRRLWRETLGDRADDVWSAFPTETPPPQARPFNAARQTWWRAVAVAATVLLVLSGAWNAVLQSELRQVQENYIGALLRVDSSTAQLTALAQLHGRELSGPMLENVTAIVLEGRDPNVQLAAVDVLLGSTAVDPEQLEARVLPRVRHNAGFVRTSLRARETQL